MTKRLFIEETTPGATGCGVRETFDPDESTMAELGWQRIPETIPPTNGHAADPVIPPLVTSDDDARYPPAGRTMNGTPVYTANNPPPPIPVHTIVKPCPVHAGRPWTLCAACRAWSEREGVGAR